MTRVSKSIFVLDKINSQILYDYIDLCFFDFTTFKIHTNFLCCFDDNYESVQPFELFSDNNKFLKDNLSNWLCELSLSYIKQSGIDFTKIRLYSVECIKSIGEIKIKNTKTVTVIFHFNDKNDGYVTTHQTRDKIFSYVVDDSKYIVMVYESL